MLKGKIVSSCSLFSLIFDEYIEQKEMDMTSPPHFILNDGLVYITRTKDTKFEIEGITESCNFITKKPNTYLVILSQGVKINNNLFPRFSILLKKNIDTINVEMVGQENLVAVFYEEND
jgi:hypothetical protein